MADAPRRVTGAYAEADYRDTTPMRRATAVYAEVDILINPEGAPSRRFFSLGGLVRFGF